MSTRAASFTIAFSAALGVWLQLAAHQAPVTTRPPIRPQANRQIDPSTAQLENWSFEFGLAGWEKTGTAFDSQPTVGDNVIASRVIGTSTVRMPLGGSYWKDLAYPIGHKGSRWIGTYERRRESSAARGTTQGDGPTGTLTSRPIPLQNAYITFLIGGGRDPERLKVELVERVAGGGTLTYADGQYRPVPGTAKTGLDIELLRRDWWDVRALRGRTVRIRIVDQAGGAWGHINVDDFRFQDAMPTRTRIQIGHVSVTQVTPHVFRPGDIASTAFADWDAPVWGATDMHNHLASHLGFGGKLVFGEPDGDIASAMANCNCLHGGWGLDNTCGNYVRSAIVGHVDEMYKFRGGIHGDHPHQGFPAFEHWPHFTTVTHQQMRHEWIRRAWEGGLKVMVTLALNNHLLAEAIDGGEPKDDRRSADLQIEYIKQFVARHSDFMELARDPAQLRDTVRRGKLAVVMGIEVDNIGNFNDSRVALNETSIRQELERLYTAGVRYFFPVHLIDNPFGGTAVVSDLFNIANKFSSIQPPPPSAGPIVPGRMLRVEHAPDPQVTYALQGHFHNGAIVALRGLVEGLEQLPNPIPFENVLKPRLADKLASESEYQIVKKYYLSPDPQSEIYRTIPAGHRNRDGLSVLGEAAIRELMRLGAMIDIDHMSERSVDRTLRLAQSVPDGGYPLNSGHNSFRAMGAPNAEAPVNENYRSDAQMRSILELSGMVGVGYRYRKSDGTGRSFQQVMAAFGGPRLTRSNVAHTCGGSSRTFAQQYLYALERMEGSFVGIGTDANGLEPAPGPRFGADAVLNGNQCAGQSNMVAYGRGTNELVPLSHGSRVWNINTDGVAHYGMLPDFFQDLRNVGVAADDLSPMFLSAEHFAQMWERSLRASARIAESRTDRP